MAHADTRVAVTVLQPQSCDTVDNINVDVLGQMGVAAATVLQQLALSPDVRALLASP